MHSHLSSWPTCFAPTKPSTDAEIRSLLACPNCPSLQETAARPARMRCFTSSLPPMAARILPMLLLASAGVKCEREKPSGGAMRAAVTEAVGRLSAEQIDIFERATSERLPALVDKLMALSDFQLMLVLDLGGGELGNLRPHALNAQGLHVLKWLLSRAIVDDRRVANGWHEHEAFGTFTRNGLLMQRLSNWDGSDTSVPLTTAEVELITLASGWAKPPYCSGRRTGMFVNGSYEHTFKDTDDQYQLHIDVYLPNIKFFVFSEDTRIERGPFHYVIGSHAATATKARWLFERTRGLTEPHQVGGAFRHANLSRQDAGGWCCASRACLEEAYHWQQRDPVQSYGFPHPKPLLVKAGTLVVVDTSGFHVRAHAHAWPSHACSRGCMPMACILTPSCSSSAPSFAALGGPARDARGWPSCTIGAIRRGGRSATWPASRACPCSFAPTAATARPSARPSAARATRCIARMTIPGPWHDTPRGRPIPRRRSHRRSACGGRCGPP